MNKTVKNTVGCFFIPIFLALRVFRIRIGLIDSRLGNSSIYMDFFLRQKQSGCISSKLRYIFFAGDYCNSFLLSKYAEHLIIVKNKFLYKIITRVCFVAIKFGVIYEGVLEDNRLSIFSLTKASLSFKEDEYGAGYAMLKSIGIDLSVDKYICVFARDSAYLKKHYPSRDWSYHDYRDVDINSYVSSIKYILSKGYKVIRIGSIVEKPLSYKHPMVFDYPYSEITSGFMDIFIPAYSSGVLGSESGATDIFKVFDKPLFIPNYPVGRWPWGHKALYMPVKYKDTKSGGVISYLEVLRRGLHMCHKSDAISKCGVDIVKNSDNEILAGTKEFINRLEGKFYYSYDQNKLIEKYYEDFVAKTSYSKIRTPIVFSYLEKNKHLFFDDLA